MQIHAARFSDTRTAPKLQLKGGAAAVQPLLEDGDVSVQYACRIQRLCAPEGAVLRVALAGDLLEVAPVLRHELRQLLHHLPHVGVGRGRGGPGRHWTQRLKGRVRCEQATALQPSSSFWKVYAWIHIFFTPLRHNIRSCSAIQAEKYFRANLYSRLPYTLTPCCERAGMSEETKHEPGTSRRWRFALWGSATFWSCSSSSLSSAPKAADTGAILGGALIPKAVFPAAPRLGPPKEKDMLLVVMLCFLLL